MEKITHLLKNINTSMDTYCGQQNNCAYNKPVSVHHCITPNINQVSCADCADTYAEQQYIKQDAKLTLNTLYGKANLDTAFKLIAAKDKEIVQLENDNKQLKSALARVNEEYRKYQNNIIDHVAKLIGKI